jgi:hypothetical protein
MLKGKELAVIVPGEKLNVLSQAGPKPVVVGGKLYFLCARVAWWQGCF